MSQAPYEASPIEIRDDLAGAHRRAWKHIASAGTWWDGEQRTAIAAEARHAANCDLCRRRKEALSPTAVQGKHDTSGGLPDNVVEVIHRIRTDPARLSEGWYKGILATGLSEEQYVETVGVVVHVVAVDTFARGLGLAQLPLPKPAPGSPTKRRPAAAKVSGAWVPWLDPKSMSDEMSDMFPPNRPVANIHRAMSLVPREVASFFDVVSAQYLPGAAMRDFSREYRAISHAQIELLAGRVSSINQCVY